MSRKGAVGPIGWVFLFLVFFIIWFLWLGKWVADTGSDAVSTTGMSGIEAFFYSNLNIVIVIAAVLGIAAYMTFGGGQ